MFLSNSGSSCGCATCFIFRSRVEGPGASSTKTHGQTQSLSSALGINGSIGLCWLRFRDREGPRCQLQHILRGRVRVAVDFDTWERLSGSSKKQTDAPPRQSRQER